MSDWNYKILDHRWNNFKRWAEALQKREDKPIMLVSDLSRMIEFIDTTHDESDKTILEILSRVGQC